MPNLNMYSYIYTFISDLKNVNFTDKKPNYMVKKTGIFRDLFSINKVVKINSIKLLSRVYISSCYLDNLYLIYSLCAKIH